MTGTISRAALLLVAASSLRAQTATSPQPLFTRSDLGWAAAFLAGTVALSTADVRITRWARTQNSPSRDTVARRLSKIQEGTLTVGNLALYGIGRLAHVPALADVTFHAAEAVVVASAASQIIRGPLGRARPYDTNYEDQYDFHWFKGFGNFKYRAFPSIHTSSAFGVATVYTLETRRRNPGAVWIVGPIAYGIAAGPALARLYQGQHWASDLLSGAFLGTFAGAKIVRYNHDVKPANRINRFFLGRDNVQASFEGSGFSVSYAF